MILGLFSTYLRPNKLQKINIDFMYTVKLELSERENVQLIVLDY